MKQSQLCSILVNVCVATNVNSTERRENEEINYVTNLFSSQVKAFCRLKCFLPSYLKLLPLVPFNLIGLISHNVSPPLKRLKWKLFTSCLSSVGAENSILKRR